MHCRDAERQIFAERDGALDQIQRAALASHLTDCAACRQIQQNFSRVIESWRIEASAIVVPDAEREWHDVRRRIRGGVVVGEQPVVAGRRWMAWIAVPVAAAAALALSLWTPEEPPHKKSVPLAQPAAAPAVARANSVEVSARDGAVVFVDDKSGWVVVWDGDSKRI